MTWIAATVRRPGGQRAAVEGRALAHPDDPVAGTVAIGARPTAVVGDLELDLAVAVAHDDARASVTGVAQDVREALLEDAVGGQVEAGRQCPGLPGHGELDGHAGVADVLDQQADLVHARLWSEGGGVLVGPQQAELRAS
jgi:hypothetical protein